MKKPTLLQFVKTVFYIGITGYGGAAITAQIKKKLVHEKEWVAEDDFMNTLSLAQILPGATGVSLMGYLGYKLKGITGWFLGPFLYVLSAFLFTTILAFLYFQYNSLPVVQKLFMGLGALVVAGVVLALTGSIFWNLFLTFSQIGVVAFGGGFTAIPLIQRIVVDGNHWLSLIQFRDGIAIGQITPGPVFITAAFIGYKVAGWLGAVFATLGVFLPSLLLMLLLGKFHEQIKHLKLVRVIIKGFLTGFIGIIGSVALQFSEKSLINWQTWAIFFASLFVIVKLKKDVIWAILGTIIVSLLVF